MRTICPKNMAGRQGVFRRALAALMSFCLLLTCLNASFLAARAAESSSVALPVGAEVTAVLQNGKLTLTGTGDTYDFSAETAPFAAYAGEVRTLVVEDGVTGLGAYLFYGMRELGGELTLPASVVRFGDCVFSGASLQEAPHFTVIRNLFESAALAPTEPEALSNEPTPAAEADASTQAEDAAVSLSEEAPPAGAQPQEPLPGDDTEGQTAHSEAQSASTPEASSSSQPEATAPPVAGSAEPGLPEAGGNQEDTAQPATPPAQTEQNADGLLPSGAAQTEPEESAQATPVTVYQQQIARPETLFSAGQSGKFVCSPQNESFRQAALAAGYEAAEGVAQVELDGRITLELPVADGRLTLPEVPEQLTGPKSDNIFFTQVFAGWTQSPDDPLAPVLAAGTLFAAKDGEWVSLYSAWSEKERYQFRIKAARWDGTAEYTLTDDGTGEPVTPPAGYTFLYQWQSAPQDGGSGAEWTDVEGETASVYRRQIDPADQKLQFRCKVTAVGLARSAGERPTLYSDPVNGVTTEKTVYVDQTAGSDVNGDGTESAPYASIEKAAESLDKSGTVDTNRIVIAGTYHLNFQGAQEKIDMAKICGVPVTIAGRPGDSAAVFQAPMYQATATSQTPAAMTLASDLRFENIAVNNIDHIYGSGYDITLGTGVTNNKDFYLYGSGQNAITEEIGAITVYSGRFARLVGYVRSTATPLDANGKRAVITVGGTANVGTIIAGCASGAIKNGDVAITVEGGTIGTLVGGNQGFNKGAAPYTGKTVISISGGNVTNVFGAGTGRNYSVPTYCGEMEIEVTGGKVSNIYGAGSAAYVVSDGTTRSKVNIFVRGAAEVGNIFAAGRGGETMDGPEEGTDPSDYGSLTGDAEIKVSGNAVVTGDVYASGQGYKDSSKYDTTQNAYLNGNVTITVEGGATVQGSVYGGGQGFADAGYENCARVKADSTVEVRVADGTVKGSVYGGGQTAKMEGSTSVVISGGTVEGNVYGGGEAGVVEGAVSVRVSGGTVESSVYGGALGEVGTTLVRGQITVNMTGGWVRGNLYGGSQKSNDGPDGSLADLVFVNVTGGTVNGNVFGGGFQGKINGSTHLHIGKGALDACAYYGGHTDEKPLLSTSALLVGGSVYAGGDFGGDSVDYQAITVTGTSHVYVDGEGYDTGAGDGKPGMTVTGGVFGSGASCDAGSTRLVTLRSYGRPIETGGTVTGATRTLAAVQRADRVTLIDTHVQLSGQSDAANANQTAKYALNRIGDKGDIDGNGNGVVLQGGSTLILDSAVIETANFKSADADGNPVPKEGLQTTPNTVRFNAGVVFQVACTDDAGKTVYGAVSGYAYMLAGDTAEAYAYARVNTGANSGDGGFQAPGESEELAYHTAGEEYRYWQVKGANATADRYTVLTAQTLKAGDNGYGSDYSVASGSIELPPVDKETAYSIESVVLPGGITLVEAAKNGLDAAWVTAAEVNGALTTTAVELAEEQKKISDSPLDTFGLFMRIGTGFQTQDVSGKVISDESVQSGGKNTVIGQKTPQTQNNGTPRIDFYLTYANNISVSKDLGTIKLVLKREEDGARTTVNVAIVTKGSSLVDQTVELYATQSGSYTGRLIIPSGDSRNLKLSNISQTANLVSAAAEPTEEQFSLTLRPIKFPGWSSENLMTDAYDLHAGAPTAVPLGTTDSRYEAVIELVLKNAPGFQAKEHPDEVTFQLSDGENNATVTLKIYWKDSIVSDVAVMSGRQYNGFSEQSAAATVSQKSAVTAAFTMGGGETAESLWLELRRKDSAEKLTLPAGTQLTLLGPSGFYSYQAKGEETTLPLSRFSKMWEESALSGNLLSGQIWTVIVDFGVADTLPNGDYTLRLRNETGADSMGAEFTVNNSEMTVSLSDGKSFSHGKCALVLSVSAGSDTRVAGGATAVLSLPEGQSFPVGTVFLCRDKTYFPQGGRVYLPLAGAADYNIEIDTTGTAGMREGSYQLTASVHPAGYGAGMAKVVTGTGAYTIQADPVYAISAAPADGEDRVVTVGTTTEVKFNVEASVQNADGEQQKIQVAVQKKGLGGRYENEDASLWSVSGNDSFQGAAAQQITVTIPASAAAGTYRLLFTLGGKTASCNLIFQ